MLGHHKYSETNAILWINPLCPNFFFCNQKLKELNDRRNTAILAKKQGEQNMGIFYIYFVSHDISNKMKVYVLAFKLHQDTRLFTKPLYYMKYPSHTIA